MASAHSPSLQDRHHPRDVDARPLGGDAGEVPPSAASGGPTRIETAIVGALWALVLLSAVLLAEALQPVHGLRGRYFANTTCSGRVVLDRLDNQLDLSLLAAPPTASWQSYCVEWTGTLLIRTSGIYTLATVSDDGSEVELVGQLVVDNRGLHPRQRREAQVRLARGAYPIRVRYDQQGARSWFELRWSTDDGPLRTLPSSALVPEDTTLMGHDARVWLAYAAALAALAGGGWIMTRTRRSWRCVASTRVARVADLVLGWIARPRVAVALLVGLGAAVRLAALRSSPAILWPDSVVFYVTVQEILRGDYFSHDAYRTLAYPHVLAAVLGWNDTPAGGTLVVFLQQAMGVASAVLFYAVGRRAFTPLVAWVGALGFAINGITLFYELSILTETLFTVVLAGAVFTASWFQRAPSMGRASALGGAAAALLLVRPVAQWYVACLGALVWLVHGTRRQKLAWTLCGLVTYGALITPLLFANQRTYGFFGIALGRGMGLYTRVFEIDELLPRTDTSHRELRDLWAHSQNEGWSPNEVRDELNYRRRYSSAQADDLMFAFARETALAHPLTFARRSLWQWILQMGSPESGVTSCVRGATRYLCSGRADGDALPAFPNTPRPEDARWLRWVVPYVTGAVLPMRAVLLAMFVGIVACLHQGRARHPIVATILLTVGYLTAVPALTQWPQDRFRLPVDAWLLMLAAWGLRSLALGFGGMLVTSHGVLEQGPPAA